jgi:hypothetical protein
MPNKRSYQHDLEESLKDPQEAAAYLNAAIEEGDRAVSFSSPYEMLSKHRVEWPLWRQRRILTGRISTACFPAKVILRLGSLNALLGALGFKLTIAAWPSKAA